MLTVGTQRKEVSLTETCCSLPLCLDVVTTDVVAQVVPPRPPEALPVRRAAQLRSPILGSRFVRGRSCHP
eukprot:4324581-Amphidinium_carterae.1